MNTEIHDTFDITIIGAGVVGLAIAEELSGQYGDVLLLEKNPNYGMETSSRHSGLPRPGQPDRDRIPRPDVVRTDRAIRVATCRGMSELRICY
ncbi:MAG: FAD-dependent oxidoreductase [Deltaproteobacteria bacterium]|nr:FAD-dependent oxidoreductase [Deltaproteobacteria bacterium]